MSAQKRRFLEGSSATPTFIGADSVFVGNIRGAGHFVVSGEVHGDGELQGGLNLSASGSWHGFIQAEQAIVAIQQHNAVYDSQATMARADRLGFQQAIGAQVAGVAADQRSEAIDIASMKSTLEAMSPTSNGSAAGSAPEAPVSPRSRPIAASPATASPR